MLFNIAHLLNLINIKESLALQILSMSDNVPDSRRPPALDSSYLRRGDVVPELSRYFPLLAPLRESIVIRCRTPPYSEAATDGGPLNLRIMCTNYFITIPLYNFPISSFDTSTASALLLLGADTIQPFSPLQLYTPYESRSCI